VWLIHCHIGWHLDAGLAAIFIDNLPTLQTSPTYAMKTLIPQDNFAACQAYNPERPPVNFQLCEQYVENDFNFQVTVSEQTKYVIGTDLIIISEAFIGLMMHKAGVLQHLLPELIGM
jgi:hypothetical protein